MRVDADRVKNNKLRKEESKQKAAAAAMAQQCKFWLKPTGCRNPETCTQGRHDEQFHGAGHLAPATGLAALKTNSQAPSGGGGKNGGHGDSCWL